MPMAFFAELLATPVAIRLGGQTLRRMAISSYERPATAVHFPEPAASDVFPDNYKRQRPAQRDHSNSVTRSLICFAAC